MSNAPERTVSAGQRLRVVWAFDRQERFPAKQYYDALSDADKAKTLAVAGRLANGQPLNKEKFKYLQGEGLYELKAGSHRFLGDYRQKGRFIVAYGARKQSPKLKKSELATAKRILMENDAVEKRKRDAKTD